MVPSRPLSVPTGMKIPDHKPLVTIFYPNKGIPETTSSHLQQWAIILSAYDYEVKYQHGNAGDLSQFPVQEEPPNLDNSSEIVCTLEQEQFQSLPITVTDIKMATAKDPVLSPVYNFTVRGRPNSAQSVDKKIKPFFSKHFQLSISNGCLLWGL